MAQHTVKKIIGVLIINLLLAMTFAYTPTGDTLTGTVTDVFGTSINQAETIESYSRTTTDTGGTDFGGILKESGSDGDSYVESRINVGQMLNVMTYIAASTLIPYGNLIGIVNHPTVQSNIILLIFAWVIFLVISAINISMYVRIYDKFINKMPE